MSRIQSSNAAAILLVLACATPGLRGQPRISPGGVVGAGLSSPAVRAISPNGIISIFGSNFAPPSTVRAVSGGDLVNGALPTSLGDVCVKVGGDFARMLLVTPGQINAQVPSLPGSGNVNVQVMTSCKSNPVTSAAEPVTLQPVAPELFTFVHGSDGRSPVAATDAISGAGLGGLALLDQIPGSNFVPARPQQIVTLYATGLGVTSPAIAAGTLATGAANVANPVSLTLNGVPLPAANLLYAGVAVGFAGLYQINFTVPDTAPSGDLGVTITLGGVTSPLGTFLSVRRVPGTGTGNQDYVSTVVVSAAQSWVASARTLQMQVKAYDPFGTPYATFAPQWQSSNTAVATIDGNGLLRGFAAGSSEIRAIAPDGAIGRMTVHVYPSQVQISPDQPNLTPGAQMTLTASALDADGKTISGTSFKWYSSVPGVATVSAQGVVSALQIGVVTLGAQVVAADPLYNFGAQVTLVIRPKTPYKLARFLSTETLNSNVTVKSMGEVSYAGNDVMAFIGRLSTGGEALMLYKDGQLKIVASAGQYLPSIGRVIDSFVSASVNAGGDVAAFVLAPNEWGGDHNIVIFRQNQPDVVVKQGCCFNLSSHALTDDGTLMFAWGNDVYMRSASGVLTRAFGQADKIPGHNSFNTPWTTRMYTSGHVYFNLDNTSLYWDGKAFQKIVAPGDSLTFRQVDWADTPVEGEPGTFYFRAGGSFGTGLFKVTNGVATAIVVSGQTLGPVRINWIHGVLDYRNGVLAFLGDADGAQAAIRYNGTSVEVVNSYSDYPSLSRAFNQGFASPAGGVVGIGAMGVDGALRWSSRVSTPVIPARASASGLVSSGFSSYYLPRGVKGASPVFRGVGDSLFNVESGFMKPILNPGDTLPGNTRLQQLCALGTSTNGNYAYVSWTDGNPGLFSVVNGGTSRLVLVGDTVGGRHVDWMNTGTGEPIAVNNAGQVAAHINFSTGTEITLFTNGVPKSILTWPSGLPGGAGTISGAYNIALDEGGRMLMAVNTNIGQALVFYDGVKLTTVLKSGDADSRGRTVTDIQGVVGAGGKLYAKIGYSGEGHGIWSYDGIGLTPVVAPGKTVAGKLYNDTYGPWFAVNSSGDIAFLANFQDGNGIVVHKSNGADLLVAHASIPLADGSWFLRFYAVGLSDQGDVYFTATSSTHASDPDRAEIFQATAQ